jgi:hypothetical protein
MNANTISKQLKKLGYTKSEKKVHGVSRTEGFEVRNLISGVRIDSHAATYGNFTANMADAERRLDGILADLTAAGFSVTRFDRFSAAVTA